MKRKTLCAIFCAILTCSLMAGTFTLAADGGEQAQAIEYVIANKIFAGDETGNLNWESGLTRAELAVLLVRLRGDEETVLGDTREYALYCHFPDVPEWAKPYIGYCAYNLLMVGYGIAEFGPSDSVTPRQACTVILRHMGLPETDWDFASAISKAEATGITPSAGFSNSAAINRAEMAILIYRAESIINAPITGETAADGSGRISEVPLTTKVLDGTDMSREDFSRYANPAAFDGAHTRAAYNAIRQSIVDRDIILAGNNEKGFNPYYNYAHAVSSRETNDAMNEVLAHIGDYYRYLRKAEPYLVGYYNYPEYFICAPTLPEVFTEANAATDDITETAISLTTDAEKVKLLNDYLCDKMAYSSTGSAGITTAFTSETRVYGKCTSFAHAFHYLCDRVDIPCVVISGEGHAWNAVYADGEWLHVDVSINTQSTDRAALLLSPVSRKTDKNPIGTLFAQELLVPGSTL